MTLEFIIGTAIFVAVIALIFRVIWRERKNLYRETKEFIQETLKRKK